MAFSATLANNRGLLSDSDHKRILDLFSRAGLSMDHPQFDEEILEKGTAAILRTRDGMLRAAVPKPLGDCVFLNDVSKDEMDKALRRHKEIMKSYPRQGEGLEAYVDSSDTGEFGDNNTANDAIHKAAEKAGSLNKANGVKDELKPVTNGAHGSINGNGVSKNTAGINGLNGAEQGVTNGTNGHTNGARA